MPQKRPTSAKSEPITIPLWSQDADGNIVAKRNAQFWHSTGKGSVECLLCYRKCKLKPGETGWCGYRGNEHGQMKLHAHGDVNSLVRDQYGYGLHVLQTYKPGALALDVGLSRCTARCSFCVSGNMVWRPEAVHWLGGKVGNTGYSGGWHSARAYLHPYGVIKQALAIGASEVEFEVNEPLLSWEYTYDVARLAKQAGLGVFIFTNGFSTPASIQKLAPYVDAIYLGLKGSAEPAFYDRWMKSPGAVPAVLKAAETWQQCGVDVRIGDVLASPHMQTDEAQAEAQRRLYAWIAETFGDLALYQPMLMQRPSATKEAQPDEFLMPASADREQTTEHIMARREQSLERARDAGLLYAIDDAYLHRCHACNAVLLRFHRPEIHCEPCIQALHYCPFWWHEQYAHDGKCDNCGTAVPIVTLPDADLAAVRRRVARETRDQKAERLPLTVFGRLAMEEAQERWDQIDAE